MSKVKFTVLLETTPSSMAVSRFNYNTFPVNLPPSNYGAGAVRTPDCQPVSGVNGRCPAGCQAVADKI